MKDQLGSSEELLTIGKIVKVHGIKGELKVLPFSGVASDLLEFKEFFVSGISGKNSFKVSKSREHGKFCVLKFISVDDRDASEKFVGREVLVPKADMPALQEDEFYWHEYEGLQVVTDTGKVLGKVTNLMATGANDVLVISGNSREYLVPVIDEIIVDVNWETETLKIKPLPGLLEINDLDAV